MVKQPNLCDLEGCDNVVETEGTQTLNDDGSTTVTFPNGLVGQVNGISFDGCCRDHFDQVMSQRCADLADRPPIDLSAPAPAPAK